MTTGERTLLVALLFTSALGKGPFDYPGSSFSNFLPKNSSGGLGYPPIPLEGYPTWDMAASTAAYFLGNDTGLNNDVELAAQARFGIVGLGWQLAMRKGPWRHLERWEAETTAAIKAINPHTKVLVSRNAETAGIFWDHCRPYFEDLDMAMSSGLWVVGQPGSGGGTPHCGVGALCNGSWGCGNCGPTMPWDNYPAVPYGQLRFNWTSPRLQEWWLHTHLAITNSSLVDGVHFDCECGEDNGIAKENLGRFDAAAIAAFGRHLPLFAAAQKMTIAWSGENVRQRSCASDMAALSHYASDRGQTFQLNYDTLDAKSFNQTLAAFLILRSEYALFEFGVIGPYECASEPCGCNAHSLPDQQCPNPGVTPGYGPYVWDELLDLDYGVPLALPTVTGHVWSRQWSMANISLDCGAWQATIDVKPA